MSDRRFKRAWLSVLVCTGIGACATLTACDDGDVEDAAEDVEDNVEDAAEDVEDAVDDVADEIDGDG